MNTHTIGDELRDGGLNAQQLVTGEIKNIFSWGRYESHGLIIPTYSVIFYLFFQNSPLTFKLASFSIALFGVATLYVWGTRVHSRGFAVLLVGILISIQHFLYYARTEVVVIFSVFWMIVILFAVWEWLKHRYWQGFIGVCALFGFVAGFHGSARTIVLMTGLLVGIIFILSEVKKKTVLWRQLLTIVVGAIAFMVGFGPRLYYTTPEIAVMSRSLFIKDSPEKKDYKAEQSLIEKVAFSTVKLVDKYQRSLMVYVYEPTTTHYSGKSSILPFASVIFVIAGLIFCLLQKDKRFLLLVYYFFMIPLTNSALTEVTNGDHRLGPIFPVAAIMAALGLYFLYTSAHNLQNRKKLLVQAILIFIAIVIHGWSFLSFFTQQYASYGMFRLDRSKVYQDFMFTDALKLIKTEGLASTGRLCFTGNKDNVSFLKELHIKEQMQYFFPDVKYQVVSRADLPDDELYISTDCSEDFSTVKWSMKAYCAEKTWFVCPPDNSHYQVLFLRQD